MGFARPDACLANGVSRDDGMEVSIGFVVPGRG